MGSSLEHWEFKLGQKFNFSIVPSIWPLYLYTSPGVLASAAVRIARGEVGGRSFFFL